MAHAARLMARVATKAWRMAWVRVLAQGHGIPAYPSTWRDAKTTKAGSLRPSFTFHRADGQTVIGFGLSMSSLYSLIARLTSFALTLPSFARAASAACAIQ